MAKRAAQGAGSIRQLKTGRWEARYTVGRDSGTGKQIQKSVYGDTQDDVRKRLTQATAAIDTGSYTVPSRLTVGAWLDIWTAEYLGGVKPRTVENYKSVSRVHLKPGAGAVKLSSLSAHMIQTLYNRLQKDRKYKNKKGEEKTKKGLSAKSIKNINGVFHSALQQAVKLGYIRINPCDAVELPRVIKKEMKILDNDAITAFLDAIQGHKWEYLFTVTLFTGARQAEILGLTWGCIDFENGTIRFESQLQRGARERIGLDTPKNDKSRRITPAPFVMMALKKQRQLQAEMQLKAAQAWTKSDYVFTNESGQTLVHGTVSKTYKRIITSIGFSDVRFHDLRHSYATAALSSGDDIKTVQENLGHHDAGFTLNQYGHVTEKMKQESAARMEGFIQSVKKTG